MICFCQYHAVVSCFIKIRIFGRPFLKRFALCYRVPSVSLSVCDVGVLWPNGWMDQDETWHADRPQRWQHGDTTPPKRGTTHPHFSAHVYCGQTAGWIKMPRGVEVGLGPGHIVLDGDPTRPIPRVVQAPFFGQGLLWPNGWMEQDATWYGDRSRPMQHCVRWGSSSR